MIPGQNPQRRPGLYPTRGSSSDPKHGWMADQPLPSKCPQAKEAPPTSSLGTAILFLHPEPPPPFLFLICQIQSVFREKCLSLHPFLPAGTVLPRDFRPPLYPVRPTSASAQGACSLPHRLSLSNPLLKYSLNLYSCPQISKDPLLQLHYLDTPYITMITFPGPSPTCPGGPCTWMTRTAPCAQIHPACMLQRPGLCFCTALAAMLGLLSLLHEVQPAFPPTPNPFPA